MSGLLRRVTTRTAESRDDWRTPSAITHDWRELCLRFALVTCDPYPSPDPAHHFAERNVRYDGRSPHGGPWGEWSGSSAIWANPPYGRALATHARDVASWYERAGLVVALVPARPGSEWWRHLARAGRSVIVPDKRLHFDDGAQPAMFPSALIVGGTNAHAARSYVAQWAPRAWVAVPSESVGLSLVAE
jgi:hypothetical protein